jgi:ATP-binding cassette, subfamily B, bacterial PglK
MRIFAKAFRHLTEKERFSVLILVLVRFLLVSFDIAGIFLVGVVVSLVSGTVISQNSNLAAFLRFIRVLGLENNYVGLAGVAIVFFIVKGVLSVLITYVTSNYLATIEASKASQLFNSLLNSPLSFQENYSRQEILQGIGPAVNAGITQAISTATILIGEITLLTGISAYLALTNVVLFAEVAIFFSIVGLVMNATLGKASTSSATAAYRESMKVQGIVLGSLDNFRQLFTSPRKSTFGAGFTAARQSMARQSATYSTITSLPRYITEISVMVGVGLLIAQRGSTPGSGISASTIAVFLAGLFRIVASMLPIQSGLTQMKRVEAESRIAFSLFDAIANQTSSVHHSRQLEKPAEISFHDVVFSYPGSPSNVLTGVSFTLPPGSYTAIVGKSGEGKSTIADLILGLREPTQGTIKIGGFTPGELSNLGYVPQVTSLLEGSLLDNLTMTYASSPEMVDLPRVSKLMHDVDLQGLVDTLPAKLQTQVGPGGIEISGGQTQRVGVIRALYGNPSVLVLDEATSALDTATEELLGNLLTELAGEVTLVVIAHRPETISRADYILTVRGGQAALERNLEPKTSR